MEKRAKMTMLYDRTVGAGKAGLPAAWLILRDVTGTKAIGTIYSILVAPSSYPELSLGRDAPRRR